MRTRGSMPRPDPSTVRKRRPRSHARPAPGRIPTARANLPEWVQAAADRVTGGLWSGADLELLAPLLQATPEAEAVWSAYGMAVAPSGEPNQGHALVLLCEVLGSLIDFDQWLRAKHGGRGDSRAKRAQAISALVRDLRSMVPMDGAAVDPTWQEHAVPLIEAHYRRHFEASGVPSGIFGNNAVDPMILAWSLARALPDTLACIADAAAAWGRGKTLAPHARGNSAARRYLVRRIYALIVREAETGRPALVAMIANLYFPRLAKLTGNMVSKMVAER